MIATTLTVGQLVAEQPARARVFERLGLDYCCGGRKPLADACAARGLDPGAVVRDLELCDAVVASLAGPDAAREPDWTRAPLGALCDHIEQTHHAYLRAELPRLTALTERVAQAHGADDPRLVELRDVFAAFRVGMEAHAAAEENAAFPLCRVADTGAVPGLAALLAQMEAEHDDAGDALSRMRALTDGFAAPAGACPTYRETLRALAELESDTHRHVHKENSILFPRALAGAA